MSDGAVTTAKAEGLDEFSLSKNHHPIRVFRGMARSQEMPGIPVTLGLAFVVAALFLVLCCIAAAIEGRLGPVYLRDDTRQVLHLKGQYPARAIPLLRDYALLGIVLIGALSFAHFARQWARIERLPALLAKDGLLRTDVVPEENLNACFGRLAARSCRPLWEVLSGLASVALVTAIIIAILQHGLYPLLDNGDAVAATHYTEWWARPANGLLGFLVFVGILLFFVHITIRHTIMGAHVLLWFADIRRCAREAGQSNWFGYRDPWIAPDEALHELRGAVVDVFLAITLGASAAACAVWALAIPPQLLGILLAYLVYNLLIVIIPWSYFNAQLGSSKRDLIASLSSDLASLKEAGADPHAKETEWLLRACERASALPERVVDRLPVGALVALYLIPIAGLIPAYR